jgi:hypothetical protein
MNEMSQIDMSVLPERVQGELIDFYQFLVEKYGRKNKKVNQMISSRLPDEFYKPINVKQYWKFSRDEIYQDV